ncbi:MAG: hypothetical protein ACRD9R_11400, partial [Pyrinomonadaceae bacterium]
EILRGSVMTHNHPTDDWIKKSDPRWKGYSFSPDDIITAAELQVAEARLVSFAYRYSMRPPRGGWDEKTAKEILLVYMRVRAKVAAELRRAVRLGLMLAEEAQASESHETWKRVASEMGLKYRRSRK